MTVELDEAQLTVGVSGSGSGPSPPPRQFTAQGLSLHGIVSSAPRSGHMPPVHRDAAHSHHRLWAVLCTCIHHDASLKRVDVVFHSVTMVESDQWWRAIKERIIQIK